MLPPELLTEAKKFVSILQQDPKLIHSPELSFLKEYLISLKAKLPEEAGKRFTPEAAETVSSTSEESSVEDEVVDSEESEIEFESTDIFTDGDEIQAMGDDSIEVSEEMSDKADCKRSEAQSEFSKGNFDTAVELYTEAIVLNPYLAMLFAKRAACYIKLRKPSCAIRDCDKAISLNPDSALAYKWRGFAKKLLANWESAYLDLQTSLKLDYSDDANDAIKELAPTYQRIHEHNLKWERKREERKYRDLQKARADRQKAYEKAKKKEAKYSSNDFHMPSGMPTGMNDVLGGLFSDPEMMAAMEDPEIQAAFTEGMSNPASFAKAQNNPKFQNVMKKMQEKMGGTNTPFVPPSNVAGDDLD